jgi:hypothetical protein
MQLRLNTQEIGMVLPLCHTDLFPIFKTQEHPRCPSSPFKAPPEVSSPISLKGLTRLRED